MGSLDALGICGGGCTADENADGICDDQQEYCSDPSACNFGEFGVGTSQDSILISLTAGDWPDEISWQLIGFESGDVYVSGTAPHEEVLLLPDECVSIVGTDSYGDGWNGAVMSLTYWSTGEVIDFTVEATTDTLGPICPQAMGSCAYPEEGYNCDGVCIAGDEDADGICDDVDPCVGLIDECGVCKVWCCSRVRLF